MTKILIFGFLILQACGHSQVNFPGSQDAVPVTASAENISKASALREYDSLALKPSSKNFVSPLTKTWQAAFQKETGLNAKEISQLYQSAALDPVFRLSKEEPRPFKISRWVFTKCRHCEFLRSFLLGSSKTFLTGTDPADEGKGSRPAVAFDPVRKNYLIVWDEKGAGGAGDIYAKLVGEEGTAVRVARKKISAARPLQGCLFSGFAEATGLSAPTDCKENVEPSAAYSDGRFLITWTKRGKAVRPAEEGFSVILGMLVDAGTLEPVSNDWKEGILLSKITFASANAGQAARNDSEVQAFAENEHAAVSAAGGAFLLVWDSNKDFVSCHEAARRGAFSIYGRVIPVAFNPRGGNRDIFPIYTDPSTALAECAPNADVSHARKPRLAYLSATKQYLVVFEVAKNVSSALPSVGGIVVSLANDLTQTVSSIHDFAPLDRQIHEGCYDPDVVATADRFLLSDEIGHEKLKLTEVTVNRGNIVPGLSRVFEAPDDLHVRRPRLAVNRVAGAEGGAQTYPLEYVAAYEAHADARRSTASQIHVVSFSLSLEPMDPRVVMPAGEYPIQLNPAVASAGAKVLTAWNGQSGEESRILSSLVTVNAPSVPNQKPAARITVTGHEEVPVVIFAGETISLSGLESSDPEDGLNLSSYRWQQVLGPLGRFADVNAAETDFIAPNVSTAANVALRLVVKDRQGLASDPAQIAVRVLPPAAVNKPPVAKISLVGAGGGIPITDLTVNESPSPDPVYDPVTGLPSWPRTRITLSGQFSNNGETPPGAVVSHRWEQVVEDATLLISGVSGENTPEFSFTVPNVLRSRGSVVITIRLTVDDDGTADNTASQDLRITVRDLNHRPTAPVLSSPTEGESFIPVRILLDWQDSIDPDIAEGDQLFYDVYWDADNPPATLIPVCNGISASRCILTDLLPQTAYSWKVRVRDLANEDLPVFYSPVAGFNTTTVDIQARWRFDDGPNGLCEGDDESKRGKRACDTSGNEKHLELVVNSGWVAHGDSFLGERLQGMLGRALGIDSNNFTNGVFNVSSASQMSIEFWVYPVQMNSGEFHSLFHSLDLTLDPKVRRIWVHYEDTGFVHFILNNTDDGNMDIHLISTQVLQRGQWNHVVCSFGPAGRRIYINGVLSGSASDNVMMNAYQGEYMIGWDQHIPSPLLGVLDEGVIYNSEFSLDVIEKLNQAH